MNAVPPENNSFAMSPTTADMVFNFAAFQVGWFACVLGAAHNWPWAGTATAAVVVAWHATHAARPLRELKLVAIAMLIGALWDSSLSMLGWLAYTSGTLIAGTAPHWILAMWALFATTLNVSLNWLKGRWLTASLLGAIAGPLAYLAGARLGAVVLVDPALAMIALGIGWAVITPLLSLLARRYDGIHTAG